MRRILLLPAVAAALAGCGTGPPEVTFAAGDASVTVGPTQYCAVDLTECDDDADATATLDVPRDTPLRVTVPESVAETPWQISFRYTTDEGIARGRTEVFAPGERSEYVLQVPDGGELQLAEVQQYGTPTFAEDQQIFRIRGAWVLSAR